MLAQIVDDFQRIGAQCFLFDEAEDIDSAIKLRQKPACFEQFEQHNIAHSKAERRQVDFAAADEFDEVVVSATAANGAELAFAIESFKDNTGVIGQAANDMIVDFDEVIEPASSQVVENRLQLRGWLAFLDKRGD